MDSRASESDPGARAGTQTHPIRMPEWDRKDVRSGCNIGYLKMSDPDARVGTQPIKSGCPSGCLTGQIRVHKRVPGLSARLTSG